MSSRNPLVTIGVPVHNGARFLRPALESLVRQTHRPLEIADRNRGAAWTYNRVFELASAPYFKWAAHDDLCAPDFVSRCVELLERDRPLERFLDDLALGDPDPAVRYAQFLRQFRRDLNRRHPGMSTKAHPTVRARAIWFDPGNRSRIRLPRWRWLREFLRSIHRAPVSRRQALRCYAATAVWASFWTRSFAGDLVR